MTHQQKLQTILFNESNNMNKLPHDLHPYIYQFVADEVKVHYWMEKYNWINHLHQLGEYYHGLFIVFAYFHHLTDCYSNDFLPSINAYREKNKFRNADGQVTRIEWSWNDDNCDYPAIYERLGNMIYEQYQERRDMNGLYKTLALLITLWNDTIDNDDIEYYY